MHKRSQDLILIVDDAPEDPRILMRALRRLGVQNPICCLENGEQLRAYVKGDTPYSDRLQHPLPAILFLALDMRILDGPPILDWLQGSGIDTNSRLFAYGERRTASEIERICKRGADLFIKKPFQEIDLLDLIYRFPESWDIGVLQKSSPTVLPGSQLRSPENLI